jgi:hypothetical protein
VIFPFPIYRSFSIVESLTLPVPTPRIDRKIPLALLFDEPCEIALIGAAPDELILRDLIGERDAGTVGRTAGFEPRDRLLNLLFLSTAG